MRYYCCYDEEHLLFYNNYIVQLIQIQAIFSFSTAFVSVIKLNRFYSLRRLDASTIQVTCWNHDNYDDQYSENQIQDASMIKDGTFFCLITNPLMHWSASWHYLFLFFLLNNLFLLLNVEVYRTTCLIKKWKMFFFQTKIEETFKNIFIVFFLKTFFRKKKNPKTSHFENSMKRNQTKKRIARRWNRITLD